MLRKTASYPVAFLGLLILLSAIFFSPLATAAATAIGKLDFAFGKPTATTADGTVRTLSKKSEIFEGDSIQTGDGRVQIRFTDNSYVALQSNTLFKVDEYKWNGKADGTEKASYNLTKGGLRTITGLIGHVNKKNYEVRTPTATIGIRGTAYSAYVSNDGVLVTVQRGLVSVSNQGGHVTISGGQSTFVRTPDSPPEMSDRSAAASSSNSTMQNDRQQEQQQQALRDLQQIPTNNVAATGDQRSRDGSSQILPQFNPSSSYSGGGESPGIPGP